MPPLPPREQQIVQAHAELIVNVVKGCQSREIKSQLEPVLQAAENYGQQALAQALRKILAGSRDLALLKALQEDDAVIVEAVLRGLQDPTSLPDPTAKPDPTAAAPGFAQLINAASKGDAQALYMLANMAEQMTSAGGDMARLGGIMKRLVDGERDADKLCERMDPRAESLVLAILEELGRLEVH